MTRLVYDETGEPMPILRFAEGASQDVAVGVASAQSAVFQAKTQAVRLVATTACRYRIGANPTAVAADTMLPANTVELVGCQGGDRIAVIQESAGGTLNVTEAD